MNGMHFGQQAHRSPVRRGASGLEMIQPTELHTAATATQTTASRHGARLRRTAGGLAAALAIFLPHGGALADDDEPVREAAQLAERVVQPSLNFAPCTFNSSLDCATLRVPVDYRKPWAGQVDLAVIRARATQPHRRIGVLFTNPGGPGGSGVDFVAQGVNAPGFVRLRERFDIVSFDVRGSHRSRAVKCVVARPADPSTVPESQLPALIDDFSGRVADACLQQNGEFVTTLSSNNIARDIDILRRSLNERQISYVGLSAGTVLGAVYASLFPHHVRAMLLDGGVLPNFRDGTVEFRAEQSLSFETVLQRLDQLCKADAACRLRGVGVVKAMDELLATLAAAPVTSPSGVVLGSGSLRRIVSTLLSTEALWPFIVDGLADARGGSFSLMFALLDFVGGNPPAGDLVLSAFTAIQCNDFGTRRPAAEVLPLSDAVTGVSSRIDARFAVASSVAQCASWPAADLPLIRNVRGRIATPILMLGTQFDPNTPLSWTRSLATTLGMERHVVRYLGGGHTAYARFGNVCVDRVGDDYLFERRLPPEGFSCAARPVAFRLGGSTEAQLRSRRAALPRAPVFEAPVSWPGRE
jgi:pimeloyl-ACP methyl ester carboxylesterase